MIRKKSPVILGFTVTLEPVIFCFWLFYGLSIGGRQKDNIFMEKVCRYELGYNETICDNRSNFVEVQTEVQKITNM